MATVPISAVCGCPGGRRHPPIRFNRSFAKALAEIYAPQQPVQTWRCGGCGTVLEIKVGDLNLAAESTAAADRELDPALKAALARAARGAT